MSDGFFSRAAGQQRRAALDNALSGFANRYLGPTGIPERLNALAELFPVAEMERGSLAAQRVAGADNWQDRVSGTGDVLSAVAAVVAPGLALNRVGSGPAVALSESLAGVSSSPTAQGAREMGARFVADEFGGMGPGKGIRAYHGSPHDFDRFSMDKIGTGEGAQAYGHGLYFAEKEAVAKGYQTSNSATASIKYNGKPITDETKKSVAWFLEQNNGDKDAVIQQWRELYKPSYFDSPLGRREMRALEKMDPAKLKAGNMYEVNINANPEDFLDWDAPLSQQPKAREAMASALGRSRVEMPDGVVQLPNGRWAPAVGGEAVGRPQGWPDKTTAEQALKYMVEDDAPYLYGKAGDILQRQNSQQQVAEALREAGIPGIRYLDAGSRGAGDGSRNYVVFDESLIEIVRKYGIAGAAAMLGMSQADVAQAMGQGQQNALAPADYTADPQEIRNYLAGL
jgi:hypothetical protein